MKILTRITCLAVALFALFTLSKGVSVALGPRTSGFNEVPTTSPTPTCFAQDLGDTVEATPTCPPGCSPSSTIGIFAQNIDSGGTDLRWERFVPTSGGPWPVAIIVPGGRWRNDALDLADVCQDLACAGFLAFSVEYRRACPHTQMTDAGPPGDGQQDPPSDGRPPEQTDDIQRAILAGRNDPHCNGKVVVLGFSAGAGHGAWWAIAGTAGQDKPDAVVGCSGPYNLVNTDILATTNADDIENYIGVHVGNSQFNTAAKAASSYWLPFTSTPCPVLLFNSDQETIPKSELLDMSTHMTHYGGSVESHLILGSSLHGHKYWCLDYGSGTTVRDRSIAFLKEVLGMP
jgi:acetyl esterase/lipase